MCPNVRADARIKAIYRFMRASTRTSSSSKDYRGPRGRKHSRLNASHPHPHYPQVTHGTWPLQQPTSIGCCPRHRITYPSTAMSPLVHHQSTHHHHRRPPWRAPVSNTDPSDLVTLKFDTTGQQAPNPTECRVPFPSLVPKPLQIGLRATFNPPGRFEADASVSHVDP